MRPVILSGTSREDVQHHVTQPFDGCSLLGAIVLMIFAGVICARAAGRFLNASKEAGSSVQ